MTADPASPIPADKFDLAAIERARTMGFPALNDHIPSLLQWLQDPNWPVFHATADLLTEAGPALLPHLRAIFVADDADWTWALLSGLCPRLPADLLERLAPDLRSLGDRFRDHPDIPTLVKNLP